MRQKIERVLNERVRPQLAIHNGGVELEDFIDGIVYVRLLGQCSNCPASYLTTENLIYTELAHAIPEVEKVVADHSVREDLLEQAKKLMGRNRGHGT